MQGKLIYYVQSVHCQYLYYTYKQQQYYLAILIQIWKKMFLIKMFMLAKLIAYYTEIIVPRKIILNAHLVIIALIFMHVTQYTVKALLNCWVQLHIN